MIVETGAALGGIKAAFDIARGISALKTESERNDAIISIQRILLEAQESALSDKQLIGELRDEVRALRRSADATLAWEAQKGRYVLTRSPIGAFTYDLKSEFVGVEVAHRLCATCFENDKKSILQTLAKHSGGELVKCQTCDVQLVLADFQHEYVSVNSRRTYDDF